MTDYSVGNISAWKANEVTDFSVNRTYTWEANEVTFHWHRWHKNLCCLKRYNMTSTEIMEMLHSQSILVVKTGQKWALEFLKNNHMENMSGVISVRWSNQAPCWTYKYLHICKKNIVSEANIKGMVEGCKELIMHFASAHHWMEYVTTSSIEMLIKHTQKNKRSQNSSSEAPFLSADQTPLWHYFDFSLF